MTSDLWKTIAAQLGETHYVPRSQIRRIIERIGPEVVQEIADEALAIEAAGGMLLPDGVTRRTVGGIFFRLLRDRLSPELVKELLPPRYPSKRKTPRSPDETPLAATTAPPQPTLPVFKWAERTTVFEDLRQQKGTISTVKITLVGRPGRIVEKQDLVIMMMDQMKPPTSFPKGVPTPPATPTTYVVYAARKQWAKVADSIKNPEDALIIEGWAAYDPGLEGVGVYVTNLSTKMQQQQKRQAQSAPPSEAG